MILNLPTHQWTRLRLPWRSFFLEAISSILVAQDQSRAADSYLHYTAFDAVFDNKLDGLDWTMLSKAMNSIHRLCDRMSIDASFRVLKGACSRYST